MSRTGDAAGFLVKSSGSEKKSGRRYQKNRADASAPTGRRTRFRLNQRRGFIGSGGTTGSSRWPPKCQNSREADRAVCCGSYIDSTLAGGATAFPSIVQRAR